MEHFDEIQEKERALTIRLMNGLSDISNVRVTGPEDPDRRVSVVSIDFLEGDNGINAFRLTQEFDISTRVGLHCAPLAHKSLGTFPEGTVRFSIGPFNTEDDIDAAIAAVHSLAADDHESL